MIRKKLTLSISSTQLTSPETDALRKRKKKQTLDLKQFVVRILVLTKTLVF